MALMCTHTYVFNLTTIVLPFWITVKLKMSTDGCDIQNTNKMLAVFTNKNTNRKNRYLKQDFKLKI